ncbi:hypothetical protein GCM10010388_05600 [Streptomyces mauvecolor]
MQTAMAIRVWVLVMRGSAAFVARVSVLFSGFVLVMVFVMGTTMDQKDIPSQSFILD